MAAIHQQKLKFAQEIMKRENIPFWLVYCIGDRDPTFTKITGGFTVGGAVIVTPLEHRIVVPELDKENFDKKNVRVYSSEITKTIAETLKELRFNPNKDMLAMNYSSMKIRDTSNTDMLGYTTKRWLSKELRKRLGASIKDISAEQIIYGIYDSKTKLELKRMGVAARRANEILEQTFQKIRPGMSEIDVSDLVKKIMDSGKPAYLKQNGVIDEALGWHDPCPIVLVGENLTKPGHTNPSKKIIKPGETIYIDFGLTEIFGDKTSYCSDIQRMGYVLKKGEKTPPKEVQLVFETLIKAINKGREFIRPGVKGFEVDSVVRNHIISIFGEKGNYNHGTGHPIGEKAHNPGTPLSVKYVPGTKNLSHRTSLKVQPWGVYTIEPRVAVPNGGSVEVMCVVKPDGSTYLLDGGQTKLYLVKP